MLPLEVSSGNLILGKKLILPRSRLPRALRISANRTPPGSKFQMASLALLPTAWVVLPGYPCGSTLLPTLDPYPRTENTSGTPNLRKAGREGSRGQNVLTTLPLLSLKPLSRPLSGQLGSFTLSAGPGSGWVPRLGQVSKEAGPRNRTACTC